MNHPANRTADDTRRGDPLSCPDRGPGGSAPDRPAAGTLAGESEDVAYAMQLRDQIPAMFTYLTLGRILKDLPAEACRIYRDKLLRDCGGPSDPVEVMILEQLMNAHLNFGLLNFKAAAADSVEVASAYWAVSARLQAEARDSGTAIGLPAPSGKSPGSKLDKEARRGDAHFDTIPIADVA